MVPVVAVDEHSHLAHNVLTFRGPRMAPQRWCSPHMVEESLERHPHRPLTQSCFSVSVVDDEVLVEHSRADQPERHRSPGQTQLVRFDRGEPLGEEVRGMYGRRAWCWGGGGRGRARGGGGAVGCG